jgi:hypothetical protein
MILTNSTEVSKLVLILIYLFGSILFAGSMTFSFIWYESETLCFANMLLNMDSEMRKLEAFVCKSCQTNIGTYTQCVFLNFRGFRDSKVLAHPKYYY